MKSSESLKHSTGRTARRLTSALLATAALAVLPAAARAEATTQPQAAGYSYAEEYKVEQTCKDWERVRRCADAAGQVQYECASKGPFAKFWASLRGRAQDDEVRVQVIRQAPEASSSSVSEERAASGQRQVSGTTRESHAKRVVTVKKGTLPTCQNVR